MPKRPIDNRLDFLSPLSLIPGMGPKKVAAMKESGLSTIGDLLYYFPFRYVDRSIITPAKDLPEHIDKTCCVIGTITKTRVERGRRQRFRIQLSDDTGSIEALWFHGIPFFRKTLHTGQRVLLTGKTVNFGNCQMIHPMIEALGRDSVAPQYPFLPVYSITGLMRDVNLLQKSLFKAILWVIGNIKHYPQILPAGIEKKNSFPPLSECLRQIHTPENPEDLERFRARIRYEELYQLALTLRWNRRKFALPGRSMSPGPLAERLRAQIPFKLTESQTLAVETLFRDAASPSRMHRLLQGDVGSGKTIVAFFACLPALNRGLQVAWLAPTEVLAGQTFRILSKWLSGLGLEAGLLKGGIPSARKQQILKDLRSGKLPFVIGTHALLQPSVSFSNLGMIVIDEQHKFGAKQRLTLQEKGPSSDFLVMSATPIPQTLAKTLYGDLDVVTIMGLPDGRMTVSTHLVPENKRGDMERFALKEIEENGSQVFYIAPRIEQDDGVSDGMKNAQEIFDGLKGGILSDVRSGMIHGRLPAEKKESIMNEFVENRLKLLVATTVVEVGVDVPNASVIIIENPEYFGLSQLHQLRGRIGRGNKKSYCFLLEKETFDTQSRFRLKEFCRQNDGFKIAELDLKLRGPGEVAGFRQTGWNDLRMADIVKDAGLFMKIQEELDKLLER